MDKIFPGQPVLGGHLLACQEVQEVLEVQVIPGHPKRSGGRKEAVNKKLKI